MNSTSDDFDAFYASTRTRLLMQTYALSGDLQAAHDGVRDGFVIAWHHWRKARHGDPEAYVRPVAWRHAHRRAQTRVWHRRRPSDPEELATLEALARLSEDQRRIFVLNHLAQGSLGTFAREVGLTDEQAARELQSATAAFSVRREIPSPLAGRALEDLRASVEAQRWPRPSILRRAGAARRRSHTLIGGAAAVAAVLLGGVAASGSTAPTLAAGGVPASSPTVRQQAPTAEPSAAAEEETTVELVADDLLAPEQLRRLAPGRAWRETRTASSAEGDGKVLPCQQARYADEQGLGALSRAFTAAKKGKRAPVVSAVQLTGLSASPSTARDAFSTTRDWFAGCSDTHVQLIGVERVAGVGNEAALVTLRQWRGAGRTVVAGVARTGQVVTTTVAQVEGPGAPDPAAVGTLLAAAVNDLCGTPGTDACAAPPALRPSPLPALGAAPGMLSEVDLPPAGGVQAAWGGTEPRKAVQNLASTSCDRADFNAAPMTNAVTRTFLVPRGRLPKTFGLTQTVGTMPARAASGFVNTIEKRIARCGDRNLGTEVTTLFSRGSARGETHLWRLDIELSDRKNQTVYMAIVRNGTALGQVLFIPAPGASLSNQQLIGLVQRSSERLESMPAPAKKSGGKKS